MSEHFFKLHFCMFEKSQGIHNSLDYRNFFGIFSINCKVYIFKAWHISKMFLHVQITQTWRVDSPYFFQMFFFLPNVHHSFRKLERILTLMIIKEKGFEFMKIVYITNLSDPKNYEFWKCGFSKSCSYLCDKRHECIICNIKSICNQNAFISNMKC